jgi:hypothetical protein
VRFGTNAPVGFTHELFEELLDAPDATLKLLIVSTTTAHAHRLDAVNIWPTKSILLCIPRNRTERTAQNHTSSQLRIMLKNGARHPTHRNQAPSYSPRLLVLPLYQRDCYESTPTPFRNAEGSFGSSRDADPEATMDVNNGIEAESGNASSDALVVADDQHGRHGGVHGSGREF